MCFNKFKNVLKFKTNFVLVERIYNNKINNNNSYPH